MGNVGGFPLLAHHLEVCLAETTSRIGGCCSSLRSGTEHDVIACGSVVGHTQCEEMQRVGGTALDAGTETRKGAGGRATALHNCRKPTENTPPNSMPESVFARHATETMGEPPHVSRMHTTATDGTWMGRQRVWMEGKGVGRGGQGQGRGGGRGRAANSGGARPPTRWGHGPAWPCPVRRATEWSLFIAGPCGSDAGEDAGDIPGNVFSPQRQKRANLTPWDDRELSET